jgi:hypothetical protein
VIGLAPAGMRGRIRDGRVHCVDDYRTVAMQAEASQLRQDGIGGAGEHVELDRVTAGPQRGGPQDHEIHDASVVTELVEQAAGRVRRADHPDVQHPRER